MIRSRSWQVKTQTKKINSREMFTQCSPQFFDVEKPLYSPELELAQLANPLYNWCDYKCLISRSWYLFVLLSSYYKRIHKELTGEDYVSDYTEMTIFQPPIPLITTKLAWTRECLATSRAAINYQIFSDLSLAFSSSVCNLSLLSLCKKLGLLCIDEEDDDRNNLWVPLL